MLASANFSLLKLSVAFPEKTGGQNIQIGNAQMYIYIYINTQKIKNIKLNVLLYNIKGNNIYLYNVLN